MIRVCAFISLLISHAQGTSFATSGSYVPQCECKCDTPQTDAACQRCRYSDHTCTDIKATCGYFLRFSQPNEQILPGGIYQRRIDNCGLWLTPVISQWPSEVWIGTTLYRKNGTMMIEYTEPIMPFVSPDQQGYDNTTCANRCCRWNNTAWVQCDPNPRTAFYAEWTVFFIVGLALMAVIWFVDGHLTYSLVCIWLVTLIMWSLSICAASDMNYWRSTTQVDLHYVSYQSCAIECGKTTKSRIVVDGHFCGEPPNNPFALWDADRNPNLIDFNMNSCNSVGYCKSCTERQNDHDILFQVAIFLDAYARLMWYMTLFLGCIIVFRNVGNAWTHVVIVNACRFMIFFGLVGIVVSAYYCWAFDNLPGIAETNNYATFGQVGFVPVHNMCIAWIPMSIVLMALYLWLSFEVSHAVENGDFYQENPQEKNNPDTNERTSLMRDVRVTPDSVQQASIQQQP